MENKVDENKAIEDTSDVNKSMDIPSEPTNHIDAENSSDNVDEEEDELSEELIRLMTKDGVEYLLNAPLPPSKGFIINDEGAPIIWNPMSLRMEPYVPEEVTIKKMSLFRFGNSGDDVFRIFCLANKGSEYKDEGLSVIRTLPISEISSWDTITDENNLISSEQLGEDDYDE